MISSEDPTPSGEDSQPSHTPSTGKPLVWYCPSRWLLAHNDVQANIQTLSSHICLADLNNDGENLLALVDFKDNPPGPTLTRSPYACRMRVYRGQQLIYNHFLEDVPSCLIATSINLPIVAQSKGGKPGASTHGKAADFSSSNPALNLNQRTLLTLAINEDVYFYHKLKPSHKLTLEDEECILDSLNKSEVDAWEMARENKIDDSAMRELLISLSQELGNHELTSHSNNFIALPSSDDRKQYLLSWKLKRLHNSLGEQIMSMDIICCAAARLRYNSSSLVGLDTREHSSTFVNSARWNRVLDIQSDGLLLGTEDRHLLIFELRSIRIRLESHHRLPSVPDHILVECRSPASFDSKIDVRALTYRVLVSCRNRQIYSIDQPYLVENKSIPRVSVRELVALKSNVLDMCWTGVDEFGGTSMSASGHPAHRPTFIVACLDRRFYCFGSESGQCKWIMETEMPITCLICLPKLKMGSDEASLIGIASQANRFDFYVSSTGRIVDSIYFQEDYPVAAKFGRFGREDNCLCIITNRGHLLVFILKRTAKFAHGQCLSSAASYASDTLASCGQILKQSIGGISETGSKERTSAPSASTNQDSGEQGKRFTMSEQVNLPNAFALSKSKSSNVTDKIIDSLILSHDCDQVTAKQALDSHATRPQLQIPMKGRDFVDQIVSESRQGYQSGRIFGRQMVSLRDKVKAAIKQESGRLNQSENEGNRVSLVNITGLGNIYRLTIAIRLNLLSMLERYHNALTSDEENSNDTQWSLSCMLTPKKHIRGYPCQIYPYKLDLNVEKNSKADFGFVAVIETTIVSKLIVSKLDFEPLDGDNLSLEAKVIARYVSPSKNLVIQRPLYLSAINVPLAC